VSANQPPDEPGGAAPGADPVESATLIEGGGSFVRHSAVMSVGTALSRLTGFLRVAAMAYALGVTESRLADAYNVANTTPNIIYELALGGILSSVFVPVFVEWLERRGPDEAWNTARAVLTVALVFLMSVMVLGILGSPWIIRLYTSSLSNSQTTPADLAAARDFASFALRWFMPQIVFYGVGAVAIGLLNAHRKFAVPMFAPVFNNVIVTATFFLFAALPGPAVPSPATITSLQRYVLVIGTTLGVVAMTVALWPSMRRIGFRFRWHWDLRDAGLRRIARLAGWTLVYVVVNQLGYLVIIVLAWRVDGGFTAYQSAFIFFQLPHAIFAVSIMTALLPSLASRWADRDPAAFRALLSQGIRATAFIVVPAAFGYLALATPVVRLLLQHGVTQAQSTELLASVLMFFSIGLFSFSSFQLLLRAFYAMQDTRTPALINIAAVALNTAVNFIFFRYLQVEGLALGHATAYTFAAVAAAWILSRRLGGLDWRVLGAALGRIMVAGVATGLAAWATSRGIGRAFGTTALGPQLLQVVAGVAAGLAAFLLVATVLKLDELEMIKRMLRERWSRRRA
jgi:putative peptidoglycan lipid II flippase